MSNKRDVLKQIGAYSSSALLTQFITAFAAVVSRRFLGPTEAGVWSALQIVMIYAAYSALGTTYATMREIPFYSGKGDLPRAEKIKDVVATFSVLSAVVVSAAICLFALSARATLSREIFFGLFFMAALVILERINNVLIALLRAYKHFTLASQQIILSAIVNALLVGFMSYRFEIYGFLWAMCLSYLFNILFIVLNQRFSFKWNLDWKEVVSLIRFGFPLLLLALVNSIFLTIDKIMIAKFMDLTMLGYYGVAILAANYIYTFPNSVSIVFIPTFQEQYGRSENVKDMKGYLSKAAMGFSNTVPLLIAAVWFFTPYGIRLILPDFSPAISAIRWLLLSSFYVALVYLFEHFLITIKRYFSIFPVTLAACLISGGGDYIAIRMGWGLVGVSVATVLAVFFKFTSIYFIAAKQLYSGRETWAIYAAANAKFVFMTLMLVFIPKIPFIGDETNLFHALFQFILFSIISLPFLHELNKEFNVLTLIRAKLDPLGRLLYGTQS